MNLIQSLRVASFWGGLKQVAYWMYGSRWGVASSGWSNGHRADKPDRIESVCQHTGRRHIGDSQRNTFESEKHDNMLWSSTQRNGRRWASSAWVPDMEEDGADKDGVPGGGDAWQSWKWAVWKRETLAAGALGREKDDREVWVRPVRGCDWEGNLHH